MTLTVALAILASALILLMVLAYWYAQRLKHDLDSGATVHVGPPITIAISAASAERLAGLSREPVYLRQSASGVRVQIDNRPLVPMSILTDQTAIKALREVAVAITERYGAVWTAVAWVGDDGAVSIQRLT